MTNRYLGSHDPNRPSDSAGEGQPLAFESEFDGMRRQVLPAEEPLFDPSRYWDLAGGGTD